MMGKGWIYHRGDIYYADLGYRTGSEQGGRRPVVVVQNDTGNFYSPTVTVVPLTSNLKKLNMPTHYILKNVPGLKKTSMALAEAIDTIDKQWILKYIGSINEEQLQGVYRALESHFGYEIPVCVEAP